MTPPSDAGLVDRVEELLLIERSRTASARGNVRQCLVTGPAGVGKTAILREAQERASAAGVLVLGSGFVEDGGIPFAAIIGAFGPLGIDVPSIPDDPAGFGGRLALQAAIADALSAACDKGPVMVCFDDVQWADPSEADLLVHLLTSQLLAPPSPTSAPLFLVASRKWSEGPLDSRLRRLALHPGATEVPVRPFGSAEIHALVRRRTGRAPATALIEQLRETTGGIPRLLEGTIERAQAAALLIVDDDGRLRAVPGVPLPVIATADDAAHARIDSLGSAAAVLANAAVLGDEVPIALIEQVTDTDPLPAIEAGAESRVLTVDGRTFRFDREVAVALREVVSRDTQADLHRRAVAAVETGAVELSPGAVLRHLRAAGEQGPRTRRWAETAGEEAAARGAWPEALAAYETAIFADPDHAASLALRAGLAAFWANDAPAAATHLNAAAADARAAGDLESWAAAELPAARLALVAPAPSGVPASRITDLLDAAAGDPDIRARVLATQADLAFLRRRFPEAVELAAAAVGAARDDTSALANAFTSLGIAHLARLELDAAREFLDRAAETARAVGDDHVGTSAEARQLLTLLMMGRFEEAGAKADALLAEQHRAGYWADAQVTMCAAIATDLAGGDFDSALRRCADAELIFDWTPYAFTPGMLFPAGAFACGARGDVAGARRLLGRWEAFGGSGVWRYRQLLAVTTEDPTGVAPELATRPWPPAPQVADLFTLEMVAAQVEVGDATATAGMVDAAQPALAAAYEAGVRYTLGWPVSVARALGTCARAGSEPDADAARTWFGRAVAEAERDGHRVEAASAGLALAYLAVETGESGAGAALRDASMRLDDLGMLGLAARVRDHRTVRRRGPGLRPPRRRAVVVTDLAVSTELNVQLGDERWVEVIADHDHTVRVRLRAHRGVEFKHTGDGICAWFDDVTSAARCGLGVVDDLTQWSTLHPDAPLRARIGIAVGAPIERGSDLFGSTVALAARLCATADPGRVLVTDEVAASLDNAVGRNEIGGRALKGFPGTIVLYELEAGAEQHN